MEEMVRERLKDHFLEATLDLILDKTGNLVKNGPKKTFALPCC